MGRVSAGVVLYYDPLSVSLCCIERQLSFPRFGFLFCPRRGHRRGSGEPFPRDSVQFRLFVVSVGDVSERFWCVIDGVHPNAGDSPCKSGQLVWGTAVFGCGSSVHTGLKVNIPRSRWMDVERQRLGVL